MKLKWRIFLLSLAFIMVAVAVTAIAILQVNFTSAVETERESAAAYHSYFSSSVKSRMMYMRMTGDVAVLENERAESIFSDIALDFGSFGDASALLITDNGNATVGAGGETGLIEIKRLPVLSSLEKDKCTTVIYDVGDKTILLGASPFSAEGRDLFVLSAHDITDTYASFDRTFRLAGAVSIGFALVISLVLFAFTALILHPVSRLNGSLCRIASGEYSSRVSEKGSVEIRSIAKNINAMAAAVEEKVIRLEAIAEGRKRYVDSLAHEMKTPLTSILGYGDLLRLKRRVSDEERLEYSTVIVDEAKRLKSLSSKLLELACADSAELEMRPVVLRELFSDISAALAPVFEHSGITLVISKSEGVIAADRELFLSLLLNLCDNARKASKSGDVVELSGSIKGDLIEIKVSDRGIGMSPDVLKRVTEPFFMADKARSRKSGGAGLGLSLCAEIASRHGAEMKIASTLGKGTEVTLTVSAVKGERI